MTTPRRRSGTEAVALSPLEAGAPPHDPDEVTLPYASVQRAVGELLPRLRLTGSARNLLRTACTRFVRHVSTEANVLCAQAQRKTISPEHVIQALEQLGLAGSAGELRACHAEFRALALSRRRTARRLEQLGVPEPELLRQQQALIDQARQEQTQVAQHEWLQIQRAAGEQAQRDSSGTDYIIDEDDDDITDD